MMGKWCAPFYAMRFLVGFYESGGDLTQNHIARVSIAIGCPCLYAV